MRSHSLAPSLPQVVEQQARVLAAKAAAAKDGLAAHSLAAPGLAAPGLAAPGLAAPGLAAPGLAAPGLAGQWEAMHAPAIGASSITAMAASGITVVSPYSSCVTVNPATGRRAIDITDLGSHEQPVTAEEMATHLKSIQHEARTRPSAMYAMGSMGSPSVSSDPHMVVPPAVAAAPATADADALAASMAGGARVSSAACGGGMGGGASSSNASVIVSRAADGLGDLSVASNGPPLPEPGLGPVGGDRGGSGGVGGGGYGGARLFDASVGHPFGDPQTFGDPQRGHPFGDPFGGYQHVQHNEEAFVSARAAGRRQVPYRR